MTLKVAIVGGKLQGVEASFLAQCLGWEVILIDRDPDVPAKGLCDSFYPCDVVEDFSILAQVVKGVDLIIPALEDVKVLKVLQQWASAAEVPLAYDRRAHFVSRSKKRSDRFFERINIPVPRPWPDCGLPVIAKPSTLSGSRGVVRLSTEGEFATFFLEKRKGANGWVIQEYLDGPSYSLEVLGLDGAYEILQVTELEMDDQYDCKRVLAPAEICATLEREFREITLTLAQNLHLTGIMDVEVIAHEGTLKVLEIDARLPSQTPAAVLASTGINMLDILGQIFVQKSLPGVTIPSHPRGVVYEHVFVSEKGVDVLGEHIMADAGPLMRRDQFFGADVALTNFAKGRFPWVATLIVTEENRNKAWEKRCKVIDRIQDFVKTTGGARERLNFHLS